MMYREFDVELLGTDHRVKNRTRADMALHPGEPFLEYVDIEHGKTQLVFLYAGLLPAIKSTRRIALHPKVTFFIGENGTGKSTLLEAIAVADGFNPEGGTRNFHFATRESHADLHRWLRLGRGVRGKRRSDGFFLRAESFYNVASEIDRLGFHPATSPYGSVSYHDQSHGESFLNLFVNRLRGDGLYLLDEPEAALSPQRQLTFLVALHELIERDAQFIIATHSPIIMAYPDAIIYEFSAEGLRAIQYKETEHYRITRAFLDRPEQMLRHLFGDEGGDSDSTGTTTATARR
jgi:predicted ATPase